MAAPRLPLKLFGPVLAATLASLAAFAEDKPAQDQEPPKNVQPWSIVLRQQLQSEKGCVVSEILTVNEFRVGDETMLEGRVSCIDGRQFDFNRKREHVKFDVRLCDPVVC
jgi:hypothetical protein